jgi:hypothetical protein
MRLHTTRYIDEGKYSRRPSFPELGRPGIHKDCFIFRDQDLVSAAGPSGMKNVFEYIMDRFVGRSASTYAYAGSEASLLAKGLELNDFFALPIFWQICNYLRFSFALAKFFS